MKFHWTEVAVEPPRRLRMVGKSRIPGMMSNEALVELSENDSGTRMVRIGRHGGWLIPLLWRLRGASMGIGRFREMDAALKERAESSSKPDSLD